MKRGKGREASNCLGPAPGLTSGHVLWMTSFNTSMWLKEAVVTSATMRKYPVSLECFFLVVWVKNLSGLHLTQKNDLNSHWGIT